jgi:hypothetical protein
MRMRERDRDEERVWMRGRERDERWMRGRDLGEEKGCG